MLCFAAVILFQMHCQMPKCKVVRDCIL